MHNNGYRIERLTEERLADLTSLHQAVYQKSVAPDFFKRKYNTAFTGLMHVGFLAYYEDKPSAFYGVIPCFIKFKNESVLAAQSADTMTHPNHRGKGLFIELAELTYRLCRTEGIRFLFGFPNQNSLPGFLNKLGWQVSANMECFIIQVKALPLQKAANKLPFLKGLYEAQVKHQLRPYLTTGNGIGNSVVGEGFAGLKRDEDYLKYKNAYSGSFTIKVGTTMVWFKINDGIVIGDIDPTPNDLNKIIPRLQKIARNIGLRKIVFQADKRTMLNMILKERVQPIPSFPVIIKNLGADLQLHNVAFTFADIDIF
ncbi:acetyltransferase (GNAT) family protein [Mucilaginibacter oryzae]|uniref:Acetyltransferase (GNAT) family protein n=1 Tax=Mucilaginibacter oryzae TaxID=468058 RepID=A0A316HFA5_9SPHI|nr:GNAT family N-acetyltransferase [Mucilaginibacter oryzae]PWK79176.1 acetyltransferase (GNAT) family protein [Mucilaginibacter oryzae]